MTRRMKILKWLCGAVTMLIATMVCDNAFAFNAIINCASTTLTTSYSTSAPSLPATLKNFETPQGPNIAAINNTTGRICFNTTSASTAAPTAGNGNEHCLAPQSILVLDKVNAPYLKMSVFVRADAASCTSGVVDIDVW